MALLLSAGGASGGSLQDSQGPQDHHVAGPPFPVTVTVDKLAFYKNGDGLNFTNQLDFHSQRQNFSSVVALLLSAGGASGGVLQ